MIYLILAWLACCCCYYVGHCFGRKKGRDDGYVTGYAVARAEWYKEHGEPRTVRIVIDGRPCTVQIPQGLN